jgi:PAS domain S-box-containing protein
MDIPTDDIEPLRSRIEELEASLRNAEGHLLGAVEAESRRGRVERDAFFASLQDGFETLDADGRILEVNDRFAEIVGRPREEIVGLRPPFPWWPPDGPQREAVQAALRDVVRGGSGEFDLTFLRPDGSTVDVILNANAVPASDGDTLGVVAIVKDVSDRVAAQAEREELLHSLTEERTRLAAAVQRLSRLQRFTASISPRLLEHDVIEALLSAARDAVGASGAAVATEQAGTLERVGASGEFDPDMVPERTGIEEEGSLADAFRTGRSIWMDPRPGWKDEEARERWAYVPLVVRGGPVGVLALCCPEDVYSEEDRSLLETMVWQAGQALERAQLVDSERRGRERLARVLAVSDAALGWLDSEEALAALLRRVREAVGADSASLLVREGDVLRVRATDGLERVPEEQVPIPIGQGFSGRIAHERTALVVEDLPTFRVVSPWLRERLRSVVGVPILRGDDVLGVLHTGSATPRNFDADDVELLTLVAARVGGALERAQLFDWARTARADASRAANRLSRLQTATAALTGAITVDEVSEAILHEAIAAVHADAGVLAVPSADGTSLDIVAVRGRQPTDRPFPASFPIDADTSICAAFRSGEAVWVPSREEWERRYPDGLGITKPWARSILAVPMRLEEDRKLGAIGLMFKAEGRLSKDERRLARAFADQGALALERARLFEAERAARDATERLQTFAASLAAVATTREVLSILVEAGADIVGASFAWAAVVDAGAQELDAVVSRGYAAEVIEPFRRMSLETPIPACDAVRGASELWFDSMVGFQQAYPGFEVPEIVHGGGFGCVPMFDAAGTAIGVASFQFGPRTAPDAHRRGDVRAIVGLAAQSLERALLYELERRVAGTLQQSLLPSVLPQDPRIAVAARYRPGTQELDVGGDWYDVIMIDEHRAALAVGDVVGHGIEAASAMGQLRSALRGLALGSSGPASVVEKLDRIARTTAPATLATIAYVEVDLARGELRYVCAGHPPPILLVGQDARLLEDGRTTPLAALPEPAAFEEGREDFGPGAVLVLYSDGLIERRGEPLDVGMGRLREQLVTAERRAPEDLADAVMTGLLGQIPQDDDVAILCVRAAPTIGPFASSIPADPRALAGLREELRTWLIDAAIPQDVRDGVVLACNEACANAVEHASLGVAGEPIAVHLRLADSTLLLEVADVGAWREGGADADRGRGVEIMRGVMDDVELSPSPEGTVVRMRLRLGAATGTEEDR